MSNAIAQSATQLAVSSNGEDDFDFKSCVKRIADRQAKGGITRERSMLNFNKIHASVCADYKAHFPSIYTNRDRLPTAVVEKIDNAITEYITAALAQVNHSNAISYRRAFFHNWKGQEVTERVTVTGENKLPLNEQHLGVTMFITAAERRLKDLEAKPTPDHEAEKKIKEQIMRLNLTKSFIEGEQKHQAELASKAK